MMLRAWFLLSVELLCRVSEWKIDKKKTFRSHEYICIINEYAKYT